MSTYKYYYQADDEELPLKTIPLVNGVDCNVKKKTPTELDILKRELEAVKLELEIMKFTTRDF